MKNPLRYQTTEYDCGSTSVENALTFLFRREEIPPLVVKHIMLYCLDSFNDKGEFAKGGTSRMAMEYLSGWLNSCSRTYGFPVRCVYVAGGDVRIAPESRIAECLQSGGVVVLRVWYECWHYILLTGAEKKYVRVFDPYFRRRPFAGGGIQLILDKPMRMNRKIPYEILNETGEKTYAAGPEPLREAVMIYRSPAP